MTPTTAAFAPATERSPLGSDYASLSWVHRACLFVLHAGLTGVVAWWAIDLSGANNNFDRSVTFHVFIEIMPQHWWSLAFAAVAIIGLLGLLPARTITLRVISAAFLATAHMMVGLLVIAGTNASLGVSAYIGLAIFGYLQIFLLTRVHLV